MTDEITTCPPEPQEGQTPQQLAAGIKYWQGELHRLEKLQAFHQPAIYLPAQNAKRAYQDALEAATPDLIPGTRRLVHGYEGVIRDRKGKVVWACGHVHCNRDNDYWWQVGWVRYAARSCAITARGQWINEKPMTGYRGYGDKDKKREVQK